MRKVVISVGAFKVLDVREYLNSDYFVVAFDPRMDVYEKYSKIESDRFQSFAFAVVGKEVSSKIFLKIIRDKQIGDNEGSNRFEASSTYQKEKFTDGSRYYVDDEYSVPTISIRSVLEEYDKIEELHINCEGEEIPIIMENPVDLFLRCKRIYVEFHLHCSHLKQTKEMVAKCVEKWKNHFTSTHIVGLEYKPFVQFDRK